MKVVVVESPAKAKTINKYLGPGYEVLASFGHVRDLPAKDGSVDPGQRFPACSGRSTTSRQKRLNDIARAVKGADTLILATDPDREGEAISWHVLEVLKEKNALKKQTDRARRVQRHHQAVGGGGDEASAPDRRRAGRRLSGAPRARLSRRLHALARCCGASCPARARPAACSRWRCGWSATASSKSRNSSPGNTGRSSRSSRRRATRTSRRAWSAPTARRSSGSTSARAQQAEDFKRALETAAFTVTSVEAKPAKRHPYPPFMTSTLQQEASRKFGFAPAHTMRIAQRLYEGIDIGGETVGLITYMRTDGVDIAPEAIAAARRVIETDYGREYVPPSPRQYQTKAKNAQEAHEAIRPTDLARRPRDVRKHARAGPGQALRADLAAHHREPDGIRRARAHHGRHHRQGGRPHASTCAPPARW